MPSTVSRKRAAVVGMHMLFARMHVPELPGKFREIKEASQFWRALIFRLSSLSALLMLLLRQAVSGSPCTPGGAGVLEYEML